MDTTDNTSQQSDSVLLIEGDTEIANLVAMNLKVLNLRTDRAHDGMSGLSMAADGDYVLVILDLMLPQLDGLPVCRGIRKKDGLIPILMLTARSDEIDRVVGLEIGADDYITKPFSIRELMARVKALLRRAQAAREAASSFGSSGPDDPGSQIDFGKLSLDPTKRKVTLEGQVVDLTAREDDPQPVTEIRFPQYYGTVHNLTIGLRTAIATNLNAEQLTAKVVGPLLDNGSGPFLVNSEDEDDYIDPPEIVGIRTTDDRKTLEVDARFPEVSNAEPRVPYRTDLAFTYQDRDAAQDFGTTILPIYVTFVEAKETIEVRPSD